MCIFNSLVILSALLVDDFEDTYSKIKIQNSKINNRLYIEYQINKILFYNLDLNKK